MPQTVYTTDEVAEIRDQYEARLQRLTAEKEKAEREKELLEQKISRLLQPLVAEFCPRSATPQSAQIPPGQSKKANTNLLPTPHQLSWRDKPLNVLPGVEQSDEM